MVLMDSMKGLVLWLLSGLSLVVVSQAQYRPKWPSPYLQREIFVLNLEDGYFGCQVNESTDFLQLFELSKLCDGIPQCFQGSDEVSLELKCTDRNHCHPKMPKCSNGVCLDNLCYCNDGFGGKGCDLPDENECKYRPCDVFAHCTNTMGSYYCSCFPGYDGDGFTCHDINECEIPSLAGLCADNAECCNLPGHFVCKCKPGFTGNATVSCTDIDECLNPHCCGRGAICENLPGSHACHCPLGFEGDPAVECWDIDECKANPCGSGALCTNTPGAYECSCPPGYRGNPTPADGCVDVDECSARLTPLCGNGANCVNTPGGYFCQCPTGYTGNPKVSCVDVDECPHSCGANTLCHNTLGSYQCECKPGFIGDPYLSAGCVDDDECLRPNTCGLNSECYNTQGSYQCVCSIGFTGNPGLVCADIDECLQNPCGSGADCVNTAGSFQCQCPDKYVARGTPELGCDRAAVDVSCKFDFDCTLNAGCVDGSCRCRPGYQISGIECIDVDECKNRNICGINAKCINSEGGYECQCRPGYEKIDSTPKSRCRDANECLFGPFPCGQNAKCINTDGGYKCLCKDGFIGNATIGCKSPCDGVECGKHANCQVNGIEAACICDQGFTFDPNNIALGCVDINECDPSHGPSGLCGQGAVCTNVLGSHHCHCQPGFTGDPFRYCEDINECDRRFGPFGQCGENSLCTNTLGNYQCSCPPGFTGNAREKCVDINECSQVFGPNGKCGFSAVCTNTVGSFSCRCPPGSHGEPFTRCVIETFCDSNTGCAGNAVCKNNKCVCPPPYFGESCKHPCDQLFCGEHAKCQLDANGNPLCACADGFEGKSNSLPGCVDINECAQKPCGQNAVCRNTPGSYECICPHNFRGDPYSECSIEGKEQIICSDNQPCPLNEECINTTIGRQCVCRRGYIRDAVGEQCRDVNECTELTKSPCGLNAFCTNLDGGFLCHCPSGYTGNSYSVCYPNVMKCEKDKECPGNTVCIDDPHDGRHCGCPTPFVREGDYCIQLSRNCSAVNKCPQNQDCLYTGSGYGYCICPKGFTLEANGFCRDINECQEMSEFDVCGHNAQCVNLPGSYECLCAPGYSGIGREGCTRIYHSCEKDSQCPTNQKCVRKWCECVPPFILDGETCKHPCDWHQCGQNAECTLGPVGPQCQCKPGCSGNPNTGCYDINECTSLLPIDPNGPCAVSAICVNVLGSYKCECNPGSEGDPYTTGCFGVAQCESNDQCPTDTICDRQAGVCIDACHSAICGPNTNCLSVRHEPQCQCKPGFSGNPNDLIQGCVTPCTNVWCGINAQCIVNSENIGVCQCMNGFSGNPWAGGGCHPETACSASKPCPPGQECVDTKCLERCNDSKCGVGAKCDIHTNQCKCLPFFVGNPDILCAPLQTPPVCSPGCGLNAHCTYSTPNKCVCNSGYSGNPYKSCTSVPRCDNISCGQGATCLEEATSVECICPSGFHGNPFLGCEDVNECLQGNPCGTGANCINVIGSYHCVCPSGFIGNPLYACQPPREAGIDDQVNGIGTSCSTTFNCPTGAVCFRGFCAQPNACKHDSQCETNNACNYVNKEIGYQCVDPCDTTQCGPNAFCITSEHKPSCFCREAHFGDPHDLDKGCASRAASSEIVSCRVDDDCVDGFSCKPSPDGDKKCIDVCSSMQCGPNALCQSMGRRPECNCQDHYEGNPYDLQKGCNPPICREDGDCRQDETCVLLPEGFRDCQSVCTDFQCGINTVCRGTGHTPYCECRPNFIGDAYDTKFGCQPLQVTCADDSSCPDSQACRRTPTGLKNCTDICLNVRCGLNAHCVGRGHQAICECLPGFIGDALRSCQKPPQHLCDTDDQCPQDKKCILTKEEIRDCVDICFGHICAEGAHCVSRNHRPQCECLQGFTRIMGDLSGTCAPNLCQSDRECRDDQICSATRTGIMDCIDVCQTVRCGPNAQCIAFEHSARCQCKPGFSGSPEDLLRGCAPQDKCTSNTDCKSHEVCILNQNGVKDCIDGCSTNLCGPNTICTTTNQFVSCTCKEGYTGRPGDGTVGCYKIPHECNSDDNCPSNAICVIGTDSINLCKDPCEHFLCGENAVCVSANHRAQCTCRQGLIGDPYHKCTDPDECKTDEDCATDSVCQTDTANTRKCANACLYARCGKNAICRASYHKTECFCSSGFDGDAFDLIKGCQPVIINVCESDDECKPSHACRQTASGILDCVDACDAVTCGPNAICKSVNHKPQCVCQPGYVGDADNVVNGCRKKETNECEFDFDCRQSTDVCKPMNDGLKKCFNACQFVNCGTGSHCVASNHMAFCECIGGFVRDSLAAVCRPKSNECNEDSHCPSFQTCRSDNVGSTKCAEACIDFTCTPNSRCVSIQHKGQCKCDPGFTGDPQSRTGCVPIPIHGCDVDNDCLNPNDVCLPDANGIRKCVDGCSDLECGKNAICIMINRQAECRCPQTGLYVGNPYDQSKGCRRVECIADRDCPDNKACSSQNHCFDPCVNGCSTNAICVVEDHKAECRCLSGYGGDPYGSGCRPKCESDKDCVLNESCLSGFCGLQCRNDNECQHNEICSLNRCLIGCRSNTQCDNHLVCTRNQCINPCEGSAACGPNALCNVINYRINCSCPQNFVGRPTADIGCTRESVACSSNNDCHYPGHLCTNNRCRPTCSSNKDCAVDEKCSNGRCHIHCSKDRDCPSGEICLENICNVGCRSDTDCASSETCINNFCMDPCASPTSCGTNAVCSVSNHEKVCSCKDGSIGNAYVECIRAMTSCGAHEPCGLGSRCESAVCRAECTSDVECFDNEKCIDRLCTIICHSDNVCPLGFVCDGALCVPGCRSDSECLTSETCINRKCLNVCASPTACGAEAICNGINHQPFCSCPTRFTGNPKIACRRMDCVVDVDCGHNFGKICKGYKCINGCRSDSGCPDDQSCISLQCTNPCLFSGVCGENAVCQSKGHQPVCSCAPPFEGNPAIRCSLPRQEAIPCRSDSDCENDKFCIHRQCITQFECNADKDCSVGHICVKGKCFAGCRRDEDCALDMTCYQQQCHDPCNFRGACGVNAECLPFNHRPKCSCPPNYTGNPETQCLELPTCRKNDDCPVGYVCQNGKCAIISGCVSDNECRPSEICDNSRCIDGCRSNSDCDFTKACINKLCRNPCSVKTCGTNSDCIAINHEGVCRCPESYIGDPSISCQLQQDECSIDNDCGSSKICVSNRCMTGCRGDLNCPFDKSCINRRCSDPCAQPTSCGFNALCKGVNHKAECSCPPNFQGDPKVHCVEKKPTVEFECEEHSHCGPGKLCEDHYCVSLRSQCFSDQACNPGEICDNGTCITGCRRDSECTFDRACYQSKCVNPCSVQTPCGQNANCHPVLHRPQCKCPFGYEGNPYDYCKAMSKVLTQKCSSDKDCYLGYLCEQGLCAMGCRVDDNCQQDMACLHRECLNPCEYPDTCGVNALCTTVGHRPRCSCPPGFTGDANIQCTPVIIPVCLHDADCGTGQICENGKCIDACRTDDTCSYTMACINQRCQDPCSVFDACGRNAFCQSENHRAFCSCPPGFTGDPLAICEREDSHQILACSSDKECSFGFVCETGSCIEGCRNDDHCTPDQTCYNRICRNPCEYPNACGINADCTPNAHKAVCSCHSGFIGDPHVECRPLQDVRECNRDTDCGNRLVCDNHRCVIGCRDSQSCGLEESCINGICQNPCSLFGVCGRNAVCKPFNHTSICSCPSGLKGNPNVVCTEAPPQCLKDSECVLGQICENTQCMSGCRLDNNCHEDRACIHGVCQNPCLLPNSCGANANCQPFNHRPRCECIPNFRGNPFVKCEPIPDDYCEQDASCPLGKICDNNKCIDGCRNDANCRFEESCINKVCQNPCNLFGACGLNAVCKPLNHDRICTCVADFTGDPKVLCERILPPPECTSDTQCPLEHICQNQRCVHGCRTSSHCPTDKACIKSKCTNPCSHSGACGKEAICSAANHVAICSCPSGFRGDPDVECREIPPECRSDEDCGQERICLKQKCIVGCRMHSNCPFDKACVNGFCQSPCSIGGMCGVNTICRAEKHEAQCSCLPGYTGDPLRQCTKVSVECEVDKDCGNGYVCANQACKDINECLKERVPCGPGASCTNLPGWFKCSCPMPLVGDAYGPTGCRSPLPVCHQDSDCKDDQKCNPATQECYDLCSRPGVCGKGAICKAVNSKAECTCPTGHRGNPYVECFIRDSCSSFADCPGNLNCLGDFCGCPKPFQQLSSFCILTSVNCSTNNPCPQNQECVYQGNNDLTGFCICPRGFVLTSDGLCRDINECEQQTFPCGPGAQCINTAGSFKCSCPPNNSGDPYGDGCFAAEQPRQECLHDSECHEDKACVDFMCINPCLKDYECGQNAICAVKNHRKECQCKPLYFGNPYEICRKPVECVTEANCPGNLLCLPDNKCGCPPDFDRQLDYCLKKSHTCTTTNPCQANQECVFTGLTTGTKSVTESGFCVCPRGFRLTSDGFCEDINECIEEPQILCSKNATCVNLLGSYECRCLDQYEGDPYREGCKLVPPPYRGCRADSDCSLTKKCDYSTGECYDPCAVRGPLEYKCGQNAICRTENHQSDCYCPPGHEGNPFKLCFKKIVCGIDYHCPGNLICLDSNTCGCPQNFFRENDYCFIKSENCTTTNPCPLNEECVYTGSASGFCVCPHGYELHPSGECVDLNECLHVTCGSGAICNNKPGGYECSCPVDTIGDPYVKGCKQIDGCRFTEDCANDRECDIGSKQCISPCYICGPHSECTARDHKAICTCPKGRIGDAYDKNVGCYIEPEPPVESRTIPPPSEILVMCLADGVQVSVQLDRFDGIIYVKGHSQDPQCRRLVTSGEGDSVDFKVLFGHCGLIHVDGEASFVLIIQKHPKLVTFRARAYHIKCVYNTGEKTITLGFNVSMITTSGTIANTGPPPTCIMSICTLEGREINSAEIGDDLLLKVDVQPDFIYGGFARSCVAKTMEDDGEFQYEVTDANGCATDPSIFGNWEYDPHRKSLMARFNAFKFPSSNNLRFQCNIRVCFGSCPPVNCEGVDAYGRRRKRQINEEDLVLTDAFKEGALREEIMVQSNAILTFEKRDPQPSLPSRVDPHKVEDIEHVCLPKLGLIISMILTTLLALVAVAVAISCWLMAYRRRPKRAGPLPHPPDFPNPLYTTPEPVAEPTPDYYPTSHNM